MNLREKVAVIVGASGGIGSAVARMMATEGARCVLVARRHGPLDALAAELPSAQLIVADVTDRNAADRVAAEARQAQGRIDVLVNAAGGPPAGSIWELSDEAWHRAFAKVLAVVSMLGSVVPQMRAQRSGRVVTIVGETGRQPRPRLLASGAANAALLAVTKGVAVDVASDGVTVNAVSPGPTQTPRLESIVDEDARVSGVDRTRVLADLVKDCPAGTLAAPEDVARAVIFLASAASSHITGVELTVDGGRTRGIT